MYMYILLVVLLAGFVSGCAQLGMSLLYSGIEVGLGGLESSFVSKPKKINGDQVAQLKSGMTKNEVNALLQKSPMMATTMGDGGSMVVYVYNTEGHGRDGSMMGVFGIMGAFTKQEKESQTLTVQFDSRGRYVSHTLEETRVCGSQATGYHADNCERKTAGVN